MSAFEREGAQNYIATDGTFRRFIVVIHSDEEGKLIVRTGLNVGELEAAEACKLAVEELTTGMVDPTKVIVTET